jgi:hypothetical protein
MFLELGDLMPHLSMMSSCWSVTGTFEYALSEYDDNSISVTGLPLF